MSALAQKNGFFTLPVADFLACAILIHASVVNQTFLTTTPPLVAIDLRDAL
jgi:hypothetical protein